MIHDIAAVAVRQSPAHLDIEALQQLSDARVGHPITLVEIDYETREFRCTQEHDEKRQCEFCSLTLALSMTF